MTKKENPLDNQPSFEELKYRVAISPLHNTLKILEYNLGKGEAHDSEREKSSGG